jgi:hypothetical protein
VHSFAVEFDKKDECKLQFIKMYLGKFHVPLGKRKWGGGQQFLRNWPEMHQVDFVDAREFHKT